MAVVAVAMVAVGVTNLVVPAQASAQDNRPNILFIMGDDHPWPAFGFMAKMHGGAAPWDATNQTMADYRTATTRADGTEAPFLHPGHPAIDADSAVNCAEVTAQGFDRLSPEFQACAQADTGTPNFDWLAARGTVFPTAYVSHPRCRESFRSTLTGLYTTQFLNNKEPGLEPKLGSFVTTAGYLTVGYGKIWQRDYTSIGFDVGDVVRNEALARMNLPGNSSHTRRDFRNLYRDNGDRTKTRVRDGLGSLGRFFDIYYDPAVYPDPAQRPPWFAWYSPRLPHGPYREGKSYVRESSSDFSGQHSSKAPKTYGNIRFLDQLLGELFDRLAETGDLDNTIIIFQSDHGFALPNSKKGEGENGYRTPILISGPGITGSQVQPHLVHAVDFLPTIMSYACEGIPAEDCVTVDKWRGSDLRPIVEGGAPNRPYVFSPKVHPLRLFVRSYDGYRLWHWREGSGDYKLYDMYNDPNEENDISAQEPAVLQRLIDELNNNFPDIL